MVSPIKEKQLSSTVIGFTLISLLFALVTLVCVQSVHAYYAKSDGIVGFVSPTKSTYMSSVGQWFHRERLSTSPSLGEVEYQMLANDRDFHDILATYSDWEDDGISFFAIDFLRDDSGSTIYQNSAGVINPPCPGGAFSTPVGDECKPFYLSKSGIKGFEPALASRGEPGGLGSKWADVRLLYDYRTGECPPYCLGSLVNHLYTTIPFKDGDKTMEGYFFNGIVGAIFIGHKPLSLSMPPPIGSNSGFTKIPGIILAWILGVIDRFRDLAVTPAKLIGPEGTVALFRYHVCDESIEPPRFISFFYTTKPSDVPKAGITLHETSPNEEPLYTERHRSELSPAASPARFGEVGRENWDRVCGPS